MRVGFGLSSSGWDSAPVGVAPRTEVGGLGLVDNSIVDFYLSLAVSGYLCFYSYGC